MTTINTWGPASIGAFNVRNTDTESVRRAIERRSGYLFCGSMRPDSHNTDATHYSGTLGKKLRSGGYSTAGEIWIAIPRDGVEVGK